MSSLVLLLLIGLVLIGGLILVAGFLFGDEPTDQQIERRQNHIEDIEDPDALVDMAKTYEKHGKWKTVLRTWNRYLELRPESVDGVFRRGKACYELGQHQQAIEDFQSVLEQKESSPSQVHLYLARSLHKRNFSQEALSHYQEYLERQPGDLSVSRETASLAQKMDRAEVARQVFNRLRKMDDTNLNVEGALSLLKLELDQHATDRAESLVEELLSYNDDGIFSRKQHHEFMYQKARYFDMKGKTNKSNDLYRMIYRENPEYRDVNEIVNEQIRNLSEKDLVQKYLRMDRNQFTRHSEEIVEQIGYEVMVSDSLNPEEIEITALDKTKMLKVNRVIFAIKKWDNQVGEMPLKELELKVLEERFDRSFFISPGGFNHRAEEYARGNPDMELVGPERLVEYLRDVRKEQL